MPRRHRWRGASRRHPGRGARSCRRDGRCRRSSWSSRAAVVVVVVGRRWGAAGGGRAAAAPAARAARGTTCSDVEEVEGLRAERPPCCAGRPRWPWSVFKVRRARRRWRRRAPRRRRTTRSARRRRRSARTAARRPCCRCASDVPNGMASEIVASRASPGPAFVTTSSYVTGWPATIGSVTSGLRHRDVGVADDLDVAVAVRAYRFGSGVGESGDDGVRQRPVGASGGTSNVTTRSPSRPGRRSPTAHGNDVHMSGAVGVTAPSVGRRGRGR